MIYNDFKGKKLSALGMGCMRFPKLGEKDTDVDIKATREMFAYAIENGVNYFDTAWVYHGGESEIITGKLLKEYPRDSFYLASKLPAFGEEYYGRKEEFFEGQLQKCGVDYFDFYLLHNVCEKNIDYFTSDEYDIKGYLLKQKQKGRIHHLGFSSHGSIETIKRALDYYGDLLEFCQLQINWLDWELQQAKEKVELLKEYGIPVWVMEPVRGGSLINLKPNFEKRLKGINPNMKNAEWAFRFLQSIPEVTVTLSGMSNMQQLKENIETFSQIRPLLDTEINTLLKIGRDMSNKDALPCTACGYCLSECPMELNIPLFTDAYNEYVYSEGDFVLPQRVAHLECEKLPSACIGCGACEKVCPQNIKISEMMERFSKKLL